MKKKLLWITGMLFMITAARSAFAQEAGKFQLFQGKYLQWDSNTNTSTEMNDLFLFDTATGDLQAYTSVTKDGKQTRYWTPAIYDQTKQ